MFKLARLSLFVLGSFCLPLIADDTATSPMQQLPPTCSNLAPAMMAFAQKLQPANQNMFCSMFSDTQRSECMSMAGTHMADGTMMTEDMAVEQVAKNSGMTPQTTAQGGCQVH